MTTRIIVLSDTHLPRAGRELPLQLLRALATADLIIHLGDFTDMSVVESLQQCAPLHAVHGNNDSAEVCRRFPAIAHVRIEERDLVLLHGHLGGRTALQAARAQQAGDIILFGHSHNPVLEEDGNRLLLNPGSPTDRRWSPHRCYAVLELGELLTARLEPLR